VQTTLLWTSHYSINSSILTLDAPSNKINLEHPQSIIQICVDNNIKDLFLIETNMSGLVRAIENCQKANINLFFGLKLVVCADIHKKDAESLSTEYKIIIFMRDEKAYKNLLRIYTTASIEGFYYRARIDCPTLEKYWDDNLLLIHPFYYSFLHRNALYLSNCNPNFNFLKEHQFFIEKNDLPFNYLIEEAIDNFGKKNKITKIPSRSIYYLNKDYFKAFVTNKAIHNRASLEVPNEEHLSSAQFSYE
jgi:DNA polymerase III subunit alpha